MKAPPHGTRRSRLFRYGGLFVAACLFAACQGTYTTELIIETCLDQDGNTLPPGVMVNVDDLSEIWKGEPLRFPIEVQEDLKLVTVKAAAGANYAFNSKTQYALSPGKTAKVSLRFFKSYDITVEAYDKYEDKLPGVDVYANGQRIGTTNNNGRLIWHIKRPLTRAGSVHPGVRFHLWLECNGQSTEARPLLFEENKYAYLVEAHLDLTRRYTSTGQCTAFNNVPSASR